MVLAGELPVHPPSDDGDGNGLPAAGGLPATDARSQGSSDDGSLPSVSSATRGASVQGSTRTIPNFSGAHGPNGIARNGSEAVSLMSLSSSAHPMKSADTRVAVEFTASARELKVFTPACMTTTDSEGGRSDDGSPQIRYVPVGRRKHSHLGLSGRANSVASLHAASFATVRRRGTAIPQLLDFLDCAKRRASRAGVDPIQPLPDSPAGSVRGGARDSRSHSPTSSTPRDGSNDSDEPTEVERLRAELERSRFDCLQMADIGSALVVDVEDAKAQLAESEAARDAAECRADITEEKLNAVLRENNEIKRALADARDAVEEEQRRHSEEVSELLIRSPRVSEADSRAEQGVALHQVRRAKLLNERVQAAKALFDLSSAEPQVLEAEHRRSIEREMWHHRIHALYGTFHDAMYAWSSCANDLEVASMSIAASRGQIQSLVQARLRAECMASQEAAHHQDACKLLAEKEALLQQLQDTVARQRVTTVRAEALGPTVQAALRKVRELSSQVEATQSITSPLRVFASPVRSPVSPVSPALPD